MSGVGTVYSQAVAELVEEVRRLVKELEMGFGDKVRVHARAISLGHVSAPAENALPGEVVYLFGPKRKDRQEEAGQEKTVGKVLRPNAADYSPMIEKARVDPDWYDAVVYALRMQLLTNKVPPVELAEFGAKVLAGEAERPAKKGRPKDIDKKIGIQELVEKAQKMGLSATRNDESEALSACDAVAEAMNVVGLQPSSYARIKAIWLRRGLEIDPIVAP